ncbi:hypothetical protein [Streptomyces sp. NPDC059215]|uniref:hypothetical protein n=1 Tax=Streptomyces sp. NPDC059215 TaxID=3346772 RepID=UPI0036992D6F
MTLNMFIKTRQRRVAVFAGAMLVVSVAAGGAAIASPGSGSEKVTLTPVTAAKEDPSHTHHATPKPLPDEVVPQGEGFTTSEPEGLVEVPDAPPYVPDGKVLKATPVGKIDPSLVQDGSTTARR